uniref:Uncharacterized protein n=1 Tax=mine drainage metagenome TaxID=410659 RepID=E6QTE6_9ZZZZ
MARQMTRRFFGLSEAYRERCASNKPESRKLDTSAHTGSQGRLMDFLSLIYRYVISHCGKQNFAIQNLGHACFVPIQRQSKNFQNTPKGVESRGLPP